MKKTIAVAVAALVLALCLAGLAYASPPQVIVNDATLTFDVPPVTEQGRTLVPLRAIFEALGAEVGYDTDTIVAIKGSTRIGLGIGSKVAYVNDDVVTLDVPAKAVNGRTLVPLRFVGEALGCQVVYQNGVITITSGAASSSPPSTGAVPPEITVHFIDVGQGDSIYIKLPDNQDILIDGGDNAYGQTVVNYLRNQGVDDIELLIATHPHADHIGGLDDVLAAFQVEEVVDPGVPASSDTYRDYWAAVQSEKCRYRTASEVRQRSYSFGKVAFTVLGPLHTNYQDVNDVSVVALLDYGDIEMLFTGDMEGPAETDLLPYLPACEVLKVGHHGSATSTCQAFLNKIRPESAVVSVGAGNRYDHPATATLQRLDQAGAEIYRTDLHGIVKVTTDELTYSIATQKTAQASAVLKGGDEISATPIVTPTQPAVAGNYVGSVKSNKYHVPTCRYAEAIAPENRIWFKTEAEALAAGYEPCGVCKP